MALVNLYKAMGGGWVVEADKMTVQPSKAEYTGDAAGGGKETPGSK